MRKIKLIRKNKYILNQLPGSPAGNLLVLMSSLQAMFLLFLVLTVCDASDYMPFWRPGAPELDLNGADPVDFEELGVLDQLRSERVVSARNSKDSFKKVSELIPLIGMDTFMEIEDSVEIASSRSIKGNYYCGNSYSIYEKSLDTDERATTLARYNFNLMDVADGRISFWSDDRDSRQRLNERWLNLYFYQKNYLKEGYKINSRPPKMITAIPPKPDPTVEELTEKLNREFDGKYLIGRKKRKKVLGLYESNINSLEQYLKPLETKTLEQKLRERQARIEEERRAAENSKKGKQYAPIVKKPETKLTPVKYVPLTRKADGSPVDSKEKRRYLSRGPEDKVMTGMFTLGNLPLPSGRFPLIAYRRTDSLGARYQVLQDNFRAGLQYARLDTVEQSVLGGNVDIYTSNDSLVGTKLYRLYDPRTANHINSLTLYGMGDIGPSAYAYGELQNIFNGATSIAAEVTASFRDTSVTTRIHSVRENWTGPEKIAPFTFDGKTTSLARLTYRFSRDSAFSLSSILDDLMTGNPDRHLGKERELRGKFYLTPTEKTLLSFWYGKRKRWNDSTDDFLGGKARYEFSPVLAAEFREEFVDVDVESAGGRAARTSLKLENRIRPNWRIFLKWSNVWDENYRMTDKEYVNYIKLGSNYNF